MYPKVRKEHKEHEKLLKSFKKHFNKDESEMEEDMEDEGEESVRPMKLYQSKKDRRVSINRDYDEDTKPHSDVYGSDGHSTDENRMYGENAESNDEGYDSISPEDDDEYEEKMEKQMNEDASPTLPKNQRKRMAVAVLTKKMSKPKKSQY